MALRKIATQEDPILRRKARKVEKFDARLAQLLEDMAQTMYEANGVGLAAPQVSMLRRAVVIDTTEDRSGLLELVNPEIIEQDGEQEGPEGCLSVPDVQGFVKRPMHVKVRAQDRNGNWFEAEGEGLLARAFCHELAHLEGQLFTDIMEYEIVPEEEQEEE
ncbi:MAG: peptide deformylase [Clostridia bacterium]|nr:peptide deformylase [Clostridia bacterium]MBR3196101.1 peptide deformylase [Clostridia bacterium]